MFSFSEAFGGVGKAIARIRAIAVFFPKLGRGHNGGFGARCRACKPGNEETQTHTAFVFEQAFTFLRKQEGISVDHVDRHLSKLARRIGRRAPGTVPYELVIRRGTRRRKPQATQLVPAASYERF